jgi:hypothetical protein
MDGDGQDLNGGQGPGPLGAVNLANVHLDELPAYEGPGMSTSIAPQPSSTVQQPTPRRPQNAQPFPPNWTGQLRDSGVVIPSNEDSGNTPSSNQTSSTQRFEPPSGPPPGYEEVQQHSVADELERRIRRASQGDA